MALPKNAVAEMRKAATVAEMRKAATVAELTKFVAEPVAIELPKLKAATVAATVAAEFTKVEAAVAEIAKSAFVNEWAETTD